MRVLVGAAVVLLALVSGCTAVVPAAPPPRLAGTAWLVTEISGEPTLTDRRPTMNFGTAGELNGNTGCNHYATSYTVSGSALTLDEVALTAMACTDAGVTEQETAFTAALDGVAAVVVDGDTARLLDSDGQVVLLLGPVPPVSLTDTSWTLVGLVDGSTMSAPVPGSTVNLSFSADAVSGKACNTFNAGYTLDGDALTVGEPATTRMMCSEPGVMEQEALVLELLAGESTVVLDRGALLLTGTDGRGLQFAKA